MHEQPIVHNKAPFGLCFTFYAGMDFVHVPGNLASWHLLQLVQVIKVLAMCDKEAFASSELIMGFLSCIKKLKKRQDPLMQMVVKQLEVMFKLHFGQKLQMQLLQQQGLRILLALEEIYTLYMN